MGKVFLPVRAMLAISVVMFLAVSAWSILGDDRGGIIVPAALVIAAALALFWGPLSILLVLGNGGVSIGDEGVTTYLFGRKVRQAPWSAVTRVEKVTFLDRQTGVNRSNFWLTLKTGRSIHFDDYLRRYSEAVDRLNTYVARYSIPAFEFDHGVKSSVGRFVGSLSTGPSRMWSTPGETGQPVSRFSV